MKNLLFCVKIWGVQKFLNGVIGMTGWNKTNSLRLARALGICAVLALSFAFAGRAAAADDYKPWVAPEDARKVKNPAPANPENLAAGEQVFRDNCVLCHGEKGVGDGVGAKALKVKPANFTDAKLMSAETDGSLFWKISAGRGPMPPWKDILSDKERWQVVDYLRKFTQIAKH
jgi:mono/diheme cytochrome c family protein